MGEDLLLKVKKNKLISTNLQSWAKEVKILDEELRQEDNWMKLRMEEMMKDRCEKRKGKKDHGFAPHLWTSNSPATSSSASTPNPMP